MEFTGYNTSLPEYRFQWLLDTAARYFHQVQVQVQQELERWYGWQPMTPDGLPYIDRCPSLNNTWVVAGHNMIGMSSGPASGELLSHLVSGQTSIIKPDHFRWR